MKSIYALTLVAIIFASNELSAQTLTYKVISLGMKTVACSGSSTGGSFAINNLPVGTYSIELSSNGESISTQEFSVGYSATAKHTGPIKSTIATSNGDDAGTGKGGGKPSGAGGTIIKSGLSAHRNDENNGSNSDSGLGTISLSSGGSSGEQISLNFAKPSTSTKSILDANASSVRLNITPNTATTVTVTATVRIRYANQN